MATYKHLTDLLKICSVLPALAIMPAMAEEPIVNNDNLAQDEQVYSSTIAGQAANDETRGGAVTIGYGVSGVSVADGTSFIGNKHLAATGGGAIKALNGFTIGNNVTFDGNTADNDGWAGALYIKLADKANPSENTTVKIGENSVFKNNSGLFGGAIGLEYGNLEIANGAQFIGNHASGTADTFGGGAIIVWQDQKDRPELHSTLKLNNATFEENTAKKYGAAIAVFDTGAETTINGGSFKKNSVTGTDAKELGGGAIYNAGIMNIDGVEFKENYGKYAGGAIYNANSGVTEVKNSLFSSNTAEQGGAINNAATAADKAGKLTVVDSVFENNYAWNGGAIRNQGKADIQIANIVGGGFVNNSSANGGAIWNGTWGKMTISGAEFKGNSVSKTSEVYNTDITSAGQGGAITNAGVLEITNATFTGNSAAGAGGAIANVTPQTKDSEIVSKIVFDTVAFENNHADEKGGAIYNVARGEIVLNGENTFSGNMAGDVANDIHNDGKFSIASGTTTLGGGITGDGTLTIADGATLNIGTTVVEQASIDIQGALQTILTDSENFGSLAAKDITTSGNGVLQLIINGVGEYDIFGETPYDDVNIKHAGVYDVTQNDTGAFVVSEKAVADIAADTGLTTNSANAVNVLLKSEDDVLNTISLMAQQDLVAGKTGNAEKELAKLNPDDKPVAQSVASSVQNQVMSLAAGRMSGASVGRSGGDLTSADYGLWVQGLYNHSKYNGKFSGDTWGISVGADTLIDGKYTLGIGYAYNDTDVDSNSRDTGIESNSLFLYGQYKPNEWYVNAALNYTMANYDESADPYGFKRKTEYDVDSFGGQIMTGYDFASGFTPEVGMRYLHISQDAYQSWLGEVDALDTDYLTGVAGVKYAFEIESASELKFRPELRAAATYDFMSDAAVATVTAPGNVAYVIDADRLSRFGGEFGIGLTAQYRGLDVSLNYELDLHEDYTSQTGMLKFRYDF